MLTRAVCEKDVALCENEVGTAVGENLRDTSLVMSTIAYYFVSSSPSTKSSFCHSNNYYQRINDRNH
jgi:hypothetical protein